MPDGAVVAAIVAGDPDGFAEAYDRYAAALYTYCTVMLPSADDAAGAVRDTFLIAAAKLEGLRDPGKLGPWLHAVARNECLRRRSTAGVTSRPPNAPGDGGQPTVEPPAALRGEVLRACTDNTPAGRATRASVAHHAGPFGPAGFPKAIGAPAPQWWSRIRRHPRAAVAVATLAAAAIGGAVVAMLALGSPHGAQASTVAGGVPGGSPGAGPGASGRPQASSAPGRPTPSVTALDRTSPGSPPSGGTAEPSATPSRTSPSPSRTSPSPSPSGTSPSPSASPSESASSPPVPGVLRATPDKLVLTSTKGKAVSGTFLLSAVDGPVSDYVIKIPAVAASEVRVSPTEGSLGDGGWVAVTVTVTSKVAVDTRLTIEPGNLAVTVLFSVKA
jgi:hypothetical protein